MNTSAAKKTKAKTKWRMIENKRVLLPKGISTETWSGGRLKLVVTWTELGKARTKSFSYTLDGLAAAKSFNDSKKKETKKYGSDFGCISVEEKRALELWREYRQEAASQGLGFVSVFDIIQKGLEDRKATSPNFQTLARFYFEKELMRKTDGKWTDHANNVSGRLFNHICPVLGEKPAHLITGDDIINFLDSLKGQGGLKASVRTRNQYLGLIKTVFRFSVQQEQLPEKYNPTRKINPIPEKAIGSPEILSVEEVKRIFAFVIRNKEYHEYIPVLALGFFCGPRLEERMKLTCNDIFVGDEKTIFISDRIAKKEKPRHIYPANNFSVWLDFARSLGVCIEQNMYFVNRDTVKQRKDAHNRMLKKISVATGITLPRNCIRHTAASYMSQLQGYDKAVQQLGHTIAIHLTNYRHAVTTKEAEAFFNILPENVNSK